MNLKDAILSTITEIQNTKEPQNVSISSKGEPFTIKEHKKIDLNDQKSDEKPTLKMPKESTESSPIIEDRFLQNLRERILVLFEGFQSPNNVDMEAKIDLTLNFLEHLLAQLDAKIETKNQHR